MSERGDIVGGNVQREAITSLGDIPEVTIVDPTGAPITAFGGTGTQYAEGATQATPTGNVILWKDATTTVLHAVSTAEPLPVWQGNLTAATDTVTAVSADLSTTGTLSAAQASLTATSTAVANSTLVLALGAGQGSWDLYLGGTIGAGTVIAFDGTLDTSASTTAWFQMSATQYGGPTLGPVTSFTLASAAVAFHGAASGLAQVRVRVSTYNGTDSITATLRASTAPSTTIKSVLAPGTNIVGTVTTNQTTHGTTDLVAADITKVNGATLSLGLASKTASLPVVLPTDQNSSINYQSFVGAAPVTGGASGLMGVGGNVASGATDVANPVKVGGVYNTTQPTVTTGQRVDAQMSARGAQIVSTGTDQLLATLAVNGTAVAFGQANSAASIPVVLAGDKTYNMQLLAGTSGGWSMSLQSALTATAVAIKASAGNLGYYYAYNPNSSVAYIQLFDLATGSVTLGTTTPTAVFGIPATSGANVAIPSGLTFATAITSAATTTATGNTAPSTALTVTFGYK